jgi:glycosyltransferase involved in cell wall biosynthesis
MIDSLGSGGAQRQMTALVRALVKQGHEVRLLVWYPQFDHFFPDVRSVGVEPENAGAKTRLGRLWKVRRMVRQQSPDCLISFLTSPNFHAVATSPGFHRIPVIVSERTIDIAGKTWANRLRFNVYRLADRVVANSVAQTDFIKSQFPFLASRTVTIVNAVDLQKFTPVPRQESTGRRIIIGASVNPVKNAHRLVEAFHRASSSLPAGALQLDWFGNNFRENGNPTADSAYYEEVVALRDRFGLQDTFRFHGPVGDMHLRFRNYDAACLPSLFEGCPNFLCEAMASGLPVLASRVSDLQNMVGEAEADGCGRLFAPLSVDEMADVLKAFAVAPGDRLATEGKNARARAERMFSPEVFAGSYGKLIAEIAG